uniref:Cysteine dioxygenase n=1 Tax=Crassostrea virginica TaxID=6565 RepID=A0A8B8C0N8_CRAVI|nr:cysteine dioxygenase type 1-like isoform X1 [Crassostrea virginica]XP_022308664.1 cysteine dioxygenase type 1-like isoform X2 [Crassostrea virginica]
MERYDLTQLQEDLRRELGNGLTDEAVEAVKRLLSKYKSNPKDWQDKEKWSDVKYTRTLLDRGNGHYNLMTLCWNTGQESPIHNHPDSHCFMKTLQGTVHEEVYKKPNTSSSCCQNCDCEMIKIADRDYKVDDVALITDNDGVHRVGNRSHVEKAVTLHLYSPPFSTCHKYDDKSSKETEVPMGFDQDFTERCCPHTC